MIKNLLMSTALVFAGAALSEKTLIDPINKTRSGIAVEGYDVVAYFVQSAPVKGSSQFTATWQGATWRFASEKNRDLFQAKPEQYAPQFGGYCAWAVGHGYTAEIDPNAWKIIDGKLYLNYSKSIQSKWQPESGKWIVEGNRNWPGLHK